MTDAERVERLLRMALTPVEPPEALSDRLERGLSELTDAAVEELAEWELSAMSDPRNWVRPVAAGVDGVASPAPTPANPVSRCSTLFSVFTGIRLKISSPSPATNPSTATTR